MFESFFPKPKMFFFTLVGWTAFVIALYYSFGKSFGTFIGFNFSEEGAATVIGLRMIVISSFLFP